jgi:hypothetical protein
MWFDLVKASTDEVDESQWRKITSKYLGRAIIYPRFKRNMNSNMVSSGDFSYYLTQDEYDEFVENVSKIKEQNNDKTPEIIFNLEDIRGRNQEDTYYQNSSYNINVMPKSKLNQMVKHDMNKHLVRKVLSRRHNKYKEIKEEFESRIYPSESEW